MIIVFTSCMGSNNNKNKKTTFNPEIKETVVEYHPTSQTEHPTITTGLKISIMVPNDFTPANQTLIQSKLLQIVSHGGISGIGGTPTIVIAPIFTLLSEGITATAPAKNMVKHNLTLYVANILTGDIYGTTSLETVGVGDSSELALQNAVSGISTTDLNIIRMINEAKQKILDYYTQNGERIITEAQTATKNNKYDEAIALLTSIPMECEVLYDKAQKVLAPIYEKNVVIYAEKALAQMRSTLSVSTPESFAEAMYYYQQIPYDTETRKKADALYNTTKSQLSAERKAELQYARDQSDKESEHARASEMMQLKMNVEGQQELINKYKKDAAYERLPWIRKVFHLGDLDPFDGSGASNFDT